MLQFVIRPTKLFPKGVGAILIARYFGEKTKNIAKMQKLLYNIQGARKEYYARKFARKKANKNKGL